MNMKKLLLLCAGVLPSVALTQAQAQGPFADACSEEDVAALSTQVEALSHQIDALTLLATDTMDIVGDVAVDVEQVEDAVSGLGSIQSIRMVQSIETVNRNVEVRVKCPPEPFELLALFYEPIGNLPVGFRMWPRGLYHSTQFNAPMIAGPGGSLSTDNRVEMLARTGVQAALASNSTIRAEMLWNSSETEDPTETISQRWTAVVASANAAECNVLILSSSPQCLTDSDCSIGLICKRNLNICGASP
jgi:hypothetical protein